MKGAGGGLEEAGLEGTGGAVLLPPSRWTTETPPVRGSVCPDCGPALQEITLSPLSAFCHVFVMFCDVFVMFF